MDAVEYPEATRMARVTGFALAVLGALALAGCSQTTGTSVALAVTGDPAIGGNPVEDAASAAILPTLDKAAQRRAREAETRALEHGRTGTPVLWRSGRTRGEVVPGPQYQVNAYTCRDLTQTIYADGPPRSTRTTSCRQPNGSWQPVT
ncbi:hypothetical protein [Bauldia litoralis]|uniref:Surface antigen n=1 Tax=Bauldia litoralis TaxID=665467 RepID=A0A1G6CFP1_9HYPH|nr:hypothetical protein [Bauldia litoralis]SDB31693.1 Surface antigen [Bauldia litoralis]